MKSYLIFYGIILCFWGTSFEVFSSEIEVPARYQLSILQRLLLTENKLQKSNKKEIIAGVVYQSGAASRSSNQTKNEIFSYVSSERMMIGDATLKFIPIDIPENNKDNLYEIFDKSLSKYGTEKYDLLIITQLRSVNYKDILRYSVTKSVLTFATSESIMKNNKFSIAITYKSNSPQVLVNLKTLQSEGFSFPTQVLKYVKTIE